VDIIFDGWRQRSPFYGESHEAVTQTVRRFIQKEALPNIDAWAEQKEVPREFNKKAGDAGILGLGFPEEYGGTSARMDLFHNLVQAEELARAGAGGIHAVLMSHFVALPPVLMLGSRKMQERIAPAVLSGEKLMALAVTEPSGGSDVARLKTRAEKRGDRYIVNGTKIFITNGIRADYYTVAVRTGGDGMGGISMLLVEKGMPGFTQTKLDKMGWHCSDTAVLYFDHVEVPAENLIGPENGGFLRILENFNRERLVAAQTCAGLARVCLEEAVDWAREAAQVLGGASYVKGTKTERLYREVRVLAIGGGSEEILLDLAGRQLGYN
jgi:acyl-CoA dehydrogenase